MATRSLLNNFLSHLPSIAISSDNVDPERVTSQQRWNIKDVQRFMVVVGLISSIFDLVTFAALLLVFHADEATFQSTKTKTTAKAARKKGGAKTPRATRADSKQARLIEMLKRPKGVSIEEIAEAFGWQLHTVRGAIAGALQKKRLLDRDLGEGRGPRPGLPHRQSHLNLGLGAVPCRRRLAGGFFRSQESRRRAEALSRPDQR